VRASFHSHDAPAYTTGPRFAVRLALDDEFRKEMTELHEAITAWNAEGDPHAEDDQIQT